MPAKKPKSWLCTLCGANGTAPTKDEANQAFYEHYLDEHSGVPF